MRERLGVSARRGYELETQMHRRRLNLETRGAETRQGARRDAFGGGGGGAGARDRPGAQRETAWVTGAGREGHPGGGGDGAAP